MRTRPPTAADHDALVHLVNRGALGGEGDVEDKPRDALITELTAPTLDADRDLRLWLDDAAPGAQAQASGLTSLGFSW